MSFAADAPVDAGDSFPSSVGHFDLLPVEIQEMILLHLSRSDPAQFWSMRRVSLHCKILVETMTDKDEGIVRRLCRSGIPINSFLQVAKHLGHSKEYCRMWNRWVSLNRAGGSEEEEGGVVTKRAVLNFKPILKFSRVPVEAVTPYGSNAVFVSLTDGQIQLMDLTTSKLLLRINNLYPAGRLECLYVPGGPQGRPRDRTNLSIDILVAVSGCRVNTYLIAEDPSSADLKIDFQTALLGFTGEPIDGISSYGPYLLVTTIARRMIWRFTTEPEDPELLNEYFFSAPSNVFHGVRPACLFPSPLQQGILTMTTVDVADRIFYPLEITTATLKNVDLPFRVENNAGPTVPGTLVGGPLKSPVRKSLAFGDSLFLLLTEDKFFSMVRLETGLDIAELGSYNTMSSLRSHVTSAHFDMNMLFLGTAKGAVFAYKMTKGKTFDPVDWVWQARAVIASAVTDINLLQKGRDGELHVIFATKQGVFLVPLA